MGRLGPGSPGPGPRSPGPGPGPLSAGIFRGLLSPDLIDELLLIICSGLILNKHLGVLTRSMFRDVCLLTLVFSFFSFSLSFFLIYSRQRKTFKSKISVFVSINAAFLPGVSFMFPCFRCFLDGLRPD